MDWPWTASGNGVVPKKGQAITVTNVDQVKIYVLRIDIFLIKKVDLFQIKWYKMISRHRTIHILLMNVHLNCRGEVSSNRNATRDESVETGDESIEARENHNNHVIIYINYINTFANLLQGMMISFKVSDNDLLFVGVWLPHNYGNNCYFNKLTYQLLIASVKTRLCLVNTFEHNACFGSSPQSYQASHRFYDSNTQYYITWGEYPRSEQGPSHG